MIDNASIDLPFDTCSSKVLDELLRRARITSAARYSRARIFSKHAAWSQWTLSFLAVGQVVVSIIPLYFKVHPLVGKIIDFGGVFFGVLVLAYSLLLGMANFNFRAEKMHACGIKMGHLSKKLYLWSCGNKATSEQYLEAVDEYYKILSKYENHETIDYLDALSNEAYLEKYKKPRNRFYIFMRKYWSFSHYIISISLFFIWVILIWVQWSGGLQPTLLS